MFRALNQPRVLALTLAAAGILMITMGIRQSFGLFVSPINQSTGMGIASISLALAVGQFSWGAIQPVAGALADRYGPRHVLYLGTVLLLLGCAITPLMQQGFGLTVALGLLAAIGSGIGSFSVLMGATAVQLPAEARGSASGVINAGGSLGQFVFAPVLQKLIQTVGWMNALWAAALTALLTLPLINRLTASHPPPRQRDAGEQGLGQAAVTAFQDRSYWLLHAGFSPAVFTLRFWSRICRVKLICVACRPRWQAGRWRLLAFSTSLAACMPGRVLPATAANIFWR